MTQVAEAITRFLLSRRAHCSPPTVQWYEAMTVEFLARYGTTQIEHITPDELRRYMSERRARTTRYGRAPSAASSNGELRALKTFFDWARTEGLTSANPALPLKRVRAFRLPKSLSVEQVEDLLYLLATGDWKEAKRDLTIFLLMYDTGLRRGEVCSLRVEHLNLPERYLDVTGKGDKLRRIGLSDLTVRELMSYLGERFQGSVFLNERGKQLRDYGLREIFRRLSKRAHIPVSPHVLRHSFATHFILGGGDIAALQWLMGHASIATTTIYIEKARALSALDAHREHSPLRQFELGDGSVPVRARLRRVK